MRPGDGEIVVRSVVIHQSCPGQFDQGVDVRRESGIGRRCKCPFLGKDVGSTDNCENDQPIVPVRQFPAAAADASPPNISTITSRWRVRHNSISVLTPTTST